MDLVPFGRYLIGRNNGLDPLAFHQYGSGPNSFRSDHSARDEGLQNQNVNSFNLRSAYASPLSPAIATVIKAFYEILSLGIYPLLSEAAARKSMSTDLPVRGLPMRSLNP
jgi:hypothetical protein